jgi:hypothetical protein
MAHDVIVWTNPDAEAGSQSLVCLKPDVLCLAVVPAAELEHVAAAAASGGAVVAQMIPLANILQLEGNDGSCDLSIQFKQGEDSTDAASLTLADCAKRDELVEAIRERLGTNWERRGQRSGRLAAAVLPASLTAIMCIFTWAIHNEAQRIAEGEHLKAVGRKATSKLLSEALHWIEGVIGATGVLIVGGLLILLSPILA